MDLKNFAVVSDRIFLADVSDEFRQAEGDKEIDERAWVIIKQATQSEAMKRADLLSRRKTEYEGDDEGRIKTISDVFEDNPLRRQMLETYWTLQDAGNLHMGDKAVFPTLPVRDMGQGAFAKIWGELPPFVAEAIHKAVLKVNVDWGPNQAK